MFFNMLQLLGGAILSIGYIPQILHIIKTKSTKDLSLNYLLLLFIGISLMEIYAANAFNHHEAQMFFVTNTVSTFLSGILVVLKLKYK